MDEHSSSSRSGDWQQLPDKQQHSAAAASVDAASSLSSPASLRSSLCAGGRTPMVNAVHLSLSFCLIFLSFSVAQNSQTSIDARLGAVGLGILYGVFTASNTFSAWLVAVTSLRLALLVGAATYALYVAANIETMPALLFASSAVIGFGAALLWTAQGGFIAGCAAEHEEQNALPPHSTMGLFNGVFFSIFQCNQFIGNLLAALLYRYRATQAAVFTVMTFICALGVASLLALPKTASLLPASDASQAASPPPTQQVEDGGDAAPLVSSRAAVRPAAAFTVSSMLSSLSLLSDVRLLLLLPMIVYSGLSQSWIYGAFPPLVLGNESRFFVLAFFGAMDAVSSFTMGRLSDRTGRLPILLLGFVAHAAVFLFIVLGFAPAIEMRPNPDAAAPALVACMPLSLPAFFLLAFLLGLGDGVFNTQVYAILGTFFRQRAEQAFANYKLVQSASTAAFFFFLFLTDVQAAAKRAVLPLACLCIAMTLALYLNVVTPLSGRSNSQRGGQSAAAINTGKHRTGGAERLADDADEDDAIRSE